MSEESPTPREAYTEFDRSTAIPQASLAYYGTGALTFSAWVVLLAGLAGGLFVWFNWGAEPRQHSYEPFVYNWVGIAAGFAVMVQGIVGYAILDGISMIVRLLDAQRLTPR